MARVKGEMPALPNPKSDELSVHNGWQKVAETGETGQNTVSREIIVEEHKFTNSPNAPIFDLMGEFVESRARKRRKRRVKGRSIVPIRIAREGQTFLDQKFNHTARPVTVFPDFSTTCANITIGSDVCPGRANSSTQQRVNSFRVVSFCTHRPQHQRDFAKLNSGGQVRKPNST